MKNEDHEKSIIDQFTKQATPFAERLGHSDESAFQIMFDLTAVNENDNVLDVACGPGLVTAAFASKAKHVTGIDITQAMIKKAKKIQEDEKLTNVSWQIGDATQLPYEDESFSMVITRYSFHHFINPMDVFKQMHRVCKKNGALMIVDVALPPKKRNKYDAMEKLRDPSHTSACTPQNIMDMAQKLDLTDIKTEWYKLEFELEEQIKASFPNPEDEEKIREIIINDIGKNELGINARWVGEKIYFNYPTLIFVGKKRS